MTSKVTLRDLTAQEAAAELESEGFRSAELKGDEAFYLGLLVNRIEQGMTNVQDEGVLEAMAWAVARLTGVDTLHPWVCTGCASFIDRAFAEDGRCPDCSSDRT